MLIKDFQWMDSNHRSLVSEATALPTETQPLPYQNLFLRWHVLPVNLCFVYNGSPFVTKRNKLINEFCTYSRSDQIRLAYGECSLIKIKRNNVFLQNHLNHFFLTNALEQLAFMRGQVCLSCVCSVTSKSRQMSTKVAQNDFTIKMKDFGHLYKNCLKISAIWAK